MSRNKKNKTVDPIKKDLQKLIKQELAKHKNKNNIPS